MLRNGRRPYIFDDADAYEAVEGNLYGPLKLLVGIGKAHEHAPEVEEAQVTDEGNFFLVLQMEHKFAEACLEVKAR